MAGGLEAGLKLMHANLGLGECPVEYRVSILRVPPWQYLSLLCEYPASTPEVDTPPFTPVKAP